MVDSLFFFRKLKVNHNHVFIFVFFFVSEVSNQRMSVPVITKFDGRDYLNQAVIPSRFIYFMKIKNCDISMGQSAWQHSIGLVFKATWHYVARIPWKLLIPSRFISWVNSFSDISRKSILLPNMIGAESHLVKCTSH